MAHTVELTTEDPGGTCALAAVLAGELQRGDVVSLTGELGAGKTCFVQGAAAALGVTERVTSPSFILRRDYEGRVPVTHIDVYRLESLHEVLDVGYGEDDSVTFVEWGDAMRPLLPTEHLEVEMLLPDVAATRLEPGTEMVADERRHVRLRPHGDGWLRRLDRLDRALAAWRKG